MNILAWALFGVINGLVLYYFDDKKETMNPALAIGLGILGALSGGTAAYLLFGGIQTAFNSTLLLVVFFEIMLLFLLISGKSIKKI